MKSRETIGQRIRSMLYSVPDDGQRDTLRRIAADADAQDGRVLGDSGKHDPTPEEMARQAEENAASGLSDGSMSALDIFAAGVRAERDMRARRGDL